MIFPRVAWATLKRELLGYFLSPVSYVLLALFLLVQGYSFFLLCQALTARQAATAAVMQYFFGGTFLYWLFLMFVVSVLTMRLLAEERQQGTLEPLLTAPVVEGALVVGKYLAALSFYVFLWTPTLAYAALLRAYSGEAAALDAGPIAAGYLGTFLCGGSALAVGLLFSGLSRTQMLAAALSFVTLSLLLLVGMLAEIYAHSARVREVLLYINLFQHMDEFGRGIVDSRRVVYHLSLAVLALLAAARILRARPGDSSGGVRAAAEGLLCVALLVGVNLLAARHPVRGDWTRARLYALSPRAQALLAELGTTGRRVQVTVLTYDTGEPDDLMTGMRELLGRAERAARGQLAVEYVDVDRDRERARLLGERYHIERDDLKQGAIVVDCGGRTKFIERRELGEYDPAADGSSGAPPLTAFHGEEALGSAILAVTSERTPMVCFTRGHGESEHDSLTGSGLSDWVRALSRENIQSRALPELRTAVPEGCDVVAVAGPERPFMTQEVEALQRYLQGGGRLLLLSGALLDRGLTRFLDTGLEELLRGAGIELGQAVAVDPEHRLGNSLAFTVEDTYGDHPITNALLRRHTLWPLARPVLPRSRDGKTWRRAASWTARELASTGERGFAETDLAALRDGHPEFTEGQDKAGPIPIAVAASVTGSSAGSALSNPTDAPAARARVVVIGSSQMAWNDSLVLFNRDLLTGSVQWLADAQSRVVIAPKRPEQFRLVLPVDAQRRLLLILVIGMPLMGLLLGLGIQWIRRS